MELVVLIFLLSAILFVGFFYVFSLMRGLVHIDYENPDQEEKEVFIVDKTKDAFNNSSGVLHDSTDLQVDPEEIKLREAMRIRKIADQKIKQAREAELDKLVVKVFQETRNFPIWITRGRDYVPMLVSEAVNLETKKNRTENYLLKINGTEYRIASKQSSGYDSSDLLITLSVFENSLKKFEVACSVNSNEWVTTYSPFSINSYKEGSWIADFKALLNEIAKLDKYRKNKQITDKKDLENIKSNFDIE